MPACLILNVEFWILNWPADGHECTRIFFSLRSFSGYWVCWVYCVPWVRWVCWVCWVCWVDWELQVQFSPFNYSTNQRINHLTIRPRNQFNIKNSQFKIALLCFLFFPPFLTFMPQLPVKHLAQETLKKNKTHITYRFVSTLPTIPSTCTLPSTKARLLLASKAAIYW